MEIEKLYLIFKQYPFVCTDSRKITQGCMFFALKGDSFDGNRFASQAIEQGASYAVVDDISVVQSEKFIYTVDVLETLQKLANYHRRELGTRILAITGTNGKTTTKELVTAVLKSQFNICFTLGNLNNHIGVPLTLLTLNSDHDFAVVEMGANHVGEIEHLCKIAEPNYGIITNIGKAHIEGFGSFDGVLKAKTELYRYLSQKKGVVLFNSNNDILKKSLRGLNSKKVSYGNDVKDFCIGKELKNDSYLSFSFLKNGDSKLNTVNTHLIGGYNLENALAACCVGMYFGVSIEKIVTAIESYIPVNSRSQLVKTKSNTLLLDYYNANPSSMEAAINNFNQLKSDGQVKCVLLGEMKEMGDSSLYEHEKLVRLLETCMFEKVYLVGNEFKCIRNNNFETFDDAEKLSKYLETNRLENAFVLIKGSRGVKMELVLGSLQN